LTANPIDFTPCFGFAAQKSKQAWDFPRGIPHACLKRTDRKIIRLWKMSNDFPNCKIGVATTAGTGQNPGMRAGKEIMRLMLALLMTWPLLIHAQQNNPDDYRTVDLDIACITGLANT
jgi:hypothetical protein